MAASKPQKSQKLTLLALLLLGAQFLCWYGVVAPDGSYLWQGTRSIKPELEIVPAVPSLEMLKASSFGDEQLAFRYNGYMMQFMGDSFGRVTPLKDYNYDRLYRWWLLLDDVDSISNLVAYVVAYYYSASQTPEKHTRYIVDFLEQHADRHPELKWWWYSQAAYNAKHKMEDTDRALKIAGKLAALPKEVDMPIWTRQLQAFMYEDKGEYKQACDIIVNVIRDYGDNKVTDGEMRFIYYFIQERLRALIEKDSSIEKADISPECRTMMDIQKASDMREKAQGLGK